MSTATDARKTMRGSDGFVWVDNIPVAMLQSVELKVTANYEEITACGDPSTYQQLNGTSGSGSIKVKKINSNLNFSIAEEFRTGVIGDHSITTKINSPTGGTERIRVTGVTFDEVTLAAFEAESIMEDEYPIKFASWTYLDRIA
ncbi:MAG: phage tail tube protein [Eubacteriales bacterium]|nr:phage tail tube protein [Eubacteriales bacterium]